jgi:hypothetical protein
LAELYEEEKWRWTSGGQPFGITDGKKDWNVIVRQGPAG